MKKILLLAALVSGISLSSFGAATPKHSTSIKTELKKAIKAAKPLDEPWSCSSVDIGCRTMVVCGTPEHQQQRAEFLQSPEGQDTYCP